MKKTLQITAILTCYLLASTILLPPAESNNYETTTQKVGEPLSNHQGLFSPTIRYVGGFGPGNYTTIQDALNDSLDGDTVFVYDDSSPYNEHLMINTSIHLIGEDTTTTVLDGNHTDDVLTVNSENTTIQGFTIQRSGREYHDRDAGIKVLSNNNTFIDLNFTYNAIGIYILSAQNNFISNCRMYYNKDGIQLRDGASHNRIENTYFISGSWYPGLYIINQSNYNILQNNTCINPEGWGFCIQESDGTIIKKNALTHSEGGLCLYEANHSMITNNYFTGNEDGITSTRSTQNTIQHNTFVNDGIYLYESFQNMVTDNMVNDKPLLYLEGASNQDITEDTGQIILIQCDEITITNQHITGSNLGIELWACTNCEITDNELIHNRRNIYLHDSEHTTISHNTLKSNESNIYKQTIEARNSPHTDINDNTIETTDDYTYIYIRNSDNTIIQDNTLSGHSLSIIMRGSDRSIIKNNILSPGSIHLRFCKNAQVRKNTLTYGALTFEGIANTIIAHNSISNDQQACGITLEDANHNVIRKNHIEQCKGGFSLTDSDWNVIAQNNIINCLLPLAWFRNSITSSWIRNYWGRSMLTPKIVFGEIRIYREWPLPPRIIPVFRFDILPRLRPF